MRLGRRHCFLVALVLATILLLVGIGGRRRRRRQESFVFGFLVNGAPGRIGIPDIPHVVVIVFHIRNNVRGRLRSVSS